MNKLLVICPTRERPERCQKMLISGKNTCNQKTTDFIFYCDEDDPKVYNYRTYIFQNWERNKVKAFYGTRKTTTQLYNQAFAMFPDYEFYCLTNDDFIFRTQ